MNDNIDGSNWLDWSDEAMDRDLDSLRRRTAAHKRERAKALRRVRAKEAVLHFARWLLAAVGRDRHA